MLALFASQAFLKSIRPFLTSRGPDELSAKDDDETSALKAFDWGHETLDIDWRGIFRLAVKAQVSVSSFLVLLVASLREIVNADPSPSPSSLHDAPPHSNPKVYQPFVVAVCTFFGSLAFKTTSAFLRTFIRNNLIR